MNLDDLKDQLKEQWESLSGQIQENPQFQTLREKFETLSAAQQKIIVGAGVALSALMLMMIPQAYFSSADENLTYFEEDRSLTQDLLKAGKPSSASVQSLDNITLDEVKSRVTTSLGTVNLLPEQIGEVKELGKTDGSLARGNIDERSLSVEVKTLNLNQIMDVGYRLQSMMPSVKLTGLNILADSKLENYFNVVFIISQFIPPEDEGAEKGSKRPRIRPRRGGGQ